MAEEWVDGRFEITNELGVAAAASATDGADALEVMVGTARTFGLHLDDATRVVDAVIEAGRARGVAVRLHAVDPLVRTVARRHGFRGDLRAALVRSASDRSDPARVAAADAPTDHAAIVGELTGLLPGTTITVREGNLGARIIRRFETGIPGCVRVVAERAGSTVAAVTPFGPDLMVESLAAAVDTMLVIEARFVSVARRIPPLVFGMAGATMVEGTVSGQADSGRISINPAHVSIGALESVLDRSGAAGVDDHRVFRSSRRPSGGFLPVDGVVAHEIGHCLDHLAFSGRIADTTDFRAQIGRALGVASVELALRGRDPEAPPAWREAHRELVAQISDYATTSGVELFAEIFKAWYEGADTSVTRAFDDVIRQWYPVPT